MVEVLSVQVVQSQVVHFGVEQEVHGSVQEEHVLGQVGKLVVVVVVVESIGGGQVGVAVQLQHPEV